MSAPGIDDLRAQARAEAIVRRPDLTMDEGDVSEMLLDGGVATADLVIGAGARGIANTYVTGARGDALDDVISDRSGLERYPANASSGELTFTRGSTGTSFTVDAGTRVATTPDTTGAFSEFTTDADIVFGSGDLSKSGPATASVGGIDGNVVAGTINRVLDTLSQSCTVTNAARFVGGTPAESDDQYIERYRANEQSKRRGTKFAVETGAKSVPGVATAVGIEDPVAQFGTLYIADANGYSNSQQVADVETELVNWRAFGIPIPVVGATLYAQTVDITLGVRTGVAIAPLITRIRAAVVSMANRLRPGDTLYRGAIETAVRNVDRDAIVSVTINTPAANITPDSDELIRISTDDVTIA